MEVIYRVLRSVIELRHEPAVRSLQDAEPFVQYVGHNLVISRVESFALRTSTHISSPTARKTLFLHNGCDYFCGMKRPVTRLTDRGVFRYVPPYRI
jgi:hypothetical protein